MRSKQQNVPLANESDDSMEFALPAVDEASDEEDEVCALKPPDPAPLKVRCFGEQSRDGVVIATEAEGSVAKVNAAANGRLARVPFA